MLSRERRLQCHPRKDYFQQLVCQCAKEENVNDLSFLMARRGVTGVKEMVPFAKVKSPNTNAAIKALNCILVTCL